MLQGQHVDHGQEEPGLGDRAQAGPGRVLIGDGLEGNRLDTWRGEERVFNRLFDCRCLLFLRPAISGFQTINPSKLIDF